MDDNRNDDWREFLSLLISKRVKFLVLGGHAVSIHAHPRVTEDLVALQARPTGEK